MNTVQSIFLPAADERPNLVGQVALIVVICSLLWDTLIVERFDVVVGGSRLYPVDLALISLLPFAVWAALVRRIPIFAGTFIWIVMLGSAFSLAFIHGILAGASWQALLRDSRNIEAVLSIFLFFAIFRDPQLVHFVPRLIVLLGRIAAVLVVIGFLFDWRVQEVDDAWLSIETQSVGESRGFGVISSYVFISFSLYLELFRLIDGNEKKTVGRYASAILLAVALGLTYVRAYLLFVILCMATASIIVSIAKVAKRPMMFKFETNVNVWVAICLSVAVVGVLAMVSDVALGVLERGASIVFPWLGGEGGEGTANFRILSFELAHERAVQTSSLLFGFGFGSLDIANPVQVELLNHNSYAWLLSVGGYVSLVLAVLALLIAPAIGCLEGHALTNMSVHAAAVTAGYMGAGFTTNHLFSSYEPTGIIVIALFLAAADVLKRQIRVLESE